MQPGVLHCKNLYATRGSRELFPPWPCLEAGDLCRASVPVVDFSVEVMQGLDIAPALAFPAFHSAGESGQCFGVDIFPHIHLNPIRQENIEYARGTGAWIVAPCSLQYQAFIYPVTVFSDSIMPVGFECR